MQGVFAFYAHERHPRTERPEGKRLKDYLARWQQERQADMQRRVTASKQSLSNQQ